MTLPVRSVQNRSSVERQIKGWDSSCMKETLRKPGTAIVAVHDKQSCHSLSLAHTADIQGQMLSLSASTDDGS